MSHPLVITLFPSTVDAVSAARAVHALGVSEEQLSIVARDHESESEMASEVGGTPGAEIEDSRPAGRLGELGAQFLAAIATVMPGIGPIVIAGPLAAELGEIAGHAVGNLRTALSRAGLDDDRIDQWEQMIGQGAILLGVHAVTVEPGPIVEALRAHGARDIVTTIWTGGE